MTQAKRVDAAIAALRAGNIDESIRIGRGGEAQTETTSDLRNGTAKLYYGIVELWKDAMFGTETTEGVCGRVKSYIVLQGVNARIAKGKHAVTLAFLNTKANIRFTRTVEQLLSEIEWTASAFNGECEWELPNAVNWESSRLLKRPAAKTRVKKDDLQAAYEHGQQNIDRAVAQLAQKEAQ
jgi:hypothetical protein